MSSITPFTASTSLLAIFGLWIVLKWMASDSHRLPPGPRGHWIIGNLIDFPRTQPWIRFLEWWQKYGDIVHVRVLGNRFVILNTMQALRDFFQLKGGIYSDRPFFVVAGEMMGLDRSTIMAHYGEEWKRQRKLTQKALNPESTKTYAGMQETIAVECIHAVLHQPSNLESLFRFAAGKISFRLAYGLEILTRDDPYLVDIEEILHRSNEAIAYPYLMEFIPVLKHLSLRFPFTPFMKNITHVRCTIDRMVDTLFNNVTDSMRSGNITTCFCAAAIQDPANAGHGMEYSVQWAAGTLFAAGTESTYTALINFICAMALFPDKQLLGRAEIIRVIGQERLVRMSDRDSLPYVNAMVKEIMRWRPPLPLGLPRRATRTANYKDYTIFEGSTVIANIWAISRDVEKPDEFVPERFLDLESKVIEPSSYIFGVGRRICPGRHIAENSLFIFIANILSTLHISRFQNPDGSFQDVNFEFSTGVSSFPKNLNVKISPSHDMAEELLLQGHSYGLELSREELEG